MKNINAFLIVLIIICGITNGCMSDAKLAQRCNEKFPCVTDSTVVIVRDTVKRDTIYLAPDTTVFVTDTIVCPPSVDTITHIQTKPCRCPVPMDIVITFEYDTTRIIYKTDSAKNFLYRDSISNLKAQVNALQYQKKRTLWFALGALVFAFLVIGFMWWFRK